MSTTYTLVFMAIGVAFALTGIIIFTYFRPRVLARDRSKEGAEEHIWVRLPGGAGVGASTPASLIIFLVGCALFVFPFTPFAEPGPDQGFFEEELSEVVPETGPSSYDSYVTITDDTESIELDVPSAWSDYRTDSFVLDGEPVAPLIQAAPDLGVWYSGFSEPGVFFSAMTSLGGLVDEDWLLDTFDQRPACVYEGRFDDYDDGLYTGKYDRWSNCEGTDTQVIVVTAGPEDRSFIAVVEVQLVSEADLEALDMILATFKVLEDFEAAWGEEALQSFSPRENVRDVVPATGPSRYDSYATIIDDTATLALDTPSVWSDIDTMPVGFESGLVAPAISAAPDLDGFAGAYWGLGVFFFATAEFSDVNSMLDSLDESAACTYEGRFDYVDPLYTGKYDLWSNCEGIGTSIVSVAATPEDRSFIAVIVVQVVSEADIEALGTILNTFVALY